MNSTISRMNKNSRGTTSTILLALASLLILISGLYLYSTKKIQSQNDTTDWKTYRNEEYGFEIKYPPDWYKEEINIPHSEDDYSFYLKPNEPSVNRDIFLIVQILRNRQAQNLYSGIKRNPNTLIKTIGNYNFYTYGPFSIDGMIEWNYHTGDENLIARFGLGIGTRNDPPPLPEAKEVEKEFQDFEQILSTFKFLDEEDEESVIGIQTNRCCPCPQRIPNSQLGKDGWVIYEEGKNYYTCPNVMCFPCPPPTELGCN